MVWVGVAVAVRVGMTGAVRVGTTASVRVGGTVAGWVGGICRQLLSNRKAMITENPGRYLYIIY
jgi:hypothetical protein